MKTRIGRYVAVALAMAGGVAGAQVPMPNPGSNRVSRKAATPEEVKAKLDAVKKAADKAFAVNAQDPALAAELAILDEATKVAKDTTAQDCTKADTAKFSGWLPSTQGQCREAFLDMQGTAITSATLVLSDKAGSVAADLYSDQFGHVVSMTIGGQMDKNDGGKEAAIQRLIQSGGNLVATFGFPIGFKGFLKKSYAGVTSYARLGFDVPAVEGTTTDPAVVGELGVVGQSRFFTDSGVIGFFAEARAAVVTSTPTFAESVGRGETRTLLDVFGLVTGGLGVFITDAIQIGVYATPGMPADLARDAPRVFVKTTITPSRKEGDGK